MASRAVKWDIWAKDVPELNDKCGKRNSYLLDNRDSNAKDRTQRVVYANGLSEAKRIYSKSDVYTGGEISVLASI